MGIKLAVFLPQLPEDWDYKHMLPCQASPAPSEKQLNTTGVL